MFYDNAQTGYTPHFVELKYKYWANMQVHVCDVIKIINKVGNHMVWMIRFTEFRAGIRTKHIRK